MAMHAVGQRLSFDSEVFCDGDLEEDKRRRARRRHRKRIARIVVEHWKWTARDALRAVRFRRCCLMATALRAFKRNVSDRKLEWRSALMMHHKRLFRQSEECLVHWHRIVSDKKSKMETLKEFGRRRKLRKLALSFRGWGQVVEYKRASRKRMLRAECYHVFARMSGCFQEWQVRAAELSLKRGMTLVALRHWSSANKRKAFQSLLVNRDRKALRKLQLLEAIGFWEVGLIRKGLAEWRQVTSLHRERRCMAVERLEAVKQSICETDVGRCLEGWQFVTQESRWEAGQRLAAEAWRETELCRKAFGRWVGFLLWKRRVSVFGQRLEVIGERLRTAMALETWQHFASIVQTERALEIRQDVLLGATFGTWCMYVGCRRRKKDLSSTAILHYRQQARHRVLVNWQCEAHHSIQSRCKWDVAGLHHRKHTLRGALMAWKKRCKEWMQKNYMLWQAEQMYAARLLRFAVDEWKCKVRVSNLESVVEEHYLSKLKQRSLEAFCLYADHKCIQEQKRRSAVRHWYLGRLGRATQAWRQHVSSRKEKLLLVGRMAAHYHGNLVSGAFATWRDEFCPDMRAFRDKIAKAALFWKMSLLQRVLYGWQKVAGELAEEKRRDAEARSLANFCLALKTIRGWAGRCREKRIKRNRMEAKLRGVIDLLSSRKLEHVWDAWVELHRIHMVEAAHMMEATAHYERGVQSRGFRTWIVFCKEKHEKNHRSNLACNLRGTLLTRRSFHAWKLGMEAIALKKQENSDAIKHWCRMMLQKSIFVWRCYVDGRKKKAALMSSALALHCQRLQQEGATKWMHVANLKRGQRIKDQGQKTAALLAEELALVAPYAQKWKRKALQRRRTVEDLSSGHDFLFPPNFCNPRNRASYREAPLRSPKLRHSQSRPPQENHRERLNALARSVIERPKARCPAFLRTAVGETPCFNPKRAPSDLTTSTINPRLTSPTPKPLSPRRDILNSKHKKQEDLNSRPAVRFTIAKDSENQPPCASEPRDACKWGTGDFPPVPSGINGASPAQVRFGKVEDVDGSRSEMVKGNCGGDQMSLEEALECFSNSSHRVSACTAEIDSLRKQLGGLGGGGDTVVEADSLLLELSKLVKEQSALRESQAHYRTLVQRIIHSDK
ncbi:hypothetical protein BSKO_03500 [Bryopsis sp. KO-2023]|nr:hypothetical protein BSKO_03500 [Bryopsis sp. KO-2023]